MIYTQRQIYDYLSLNPLNVEVFVGDTENLNGGDYIFFDITNESLINYDDKGAYQTYIQITIATKNYDSRNMLVNYVKNYLNVSVNYEKAIDFEYFIARCECGILMKTEQLSV